MKVLILAAGDGVRWNNYRDSPKHLVTIENQVLLNRTTNQFLKYTKDVVIVGNDKRYLVEGATLVIPVKEKGSWCEMDKFASSLDLWGDEQTVVVFGDVYFTDEAVDLISQGVESWMCFCRTKPSKITGKDCKEIFAFSFNNCFYNEAKLAIKYLLNYEPEIKSAGGWSLFRYLTVGSPEKNRGEAYDSSRFVEIDDWTEDFDYPKDLDIWEAKRSMPLED